MSEFSLGGLCCVADRSGALYLPDARALVVADMHLEKSSHFAARGQFLPPYESKVTLAKLAEVIAHFDPRLVIALGDSFHDRTGHRNLSEENRSMLAAIQRGRDWLWIAGNHDPSDLDGMGGSGASEHTIGSLILRHIPAEGDETEIAGHLHPVARVVLHGHAIQRRCFIHSRRRLILPAFGAFTGGLDVRDAIFARLFPHEKPSIYLAR